MKSFVVVSGAVMALVLSACSSTPSLPSGMSVGQFSRVVCEGGSSFSLRFAEAGQSVRVRALHGAAELERGQDGAYTGDGYRLTLDGADGLALTHNGKSMGRQCKPAV